MKFKTKYKILLLKQYFDKGFGVTNYFKYIIAFFGLASREISTTLWIAFAYGIACFIVGWAWFKFDLVKVEQEISNDYNIFVQETRKKLRLKSEETFK